MSPDTETQILARLGALEIQNAQSSTHWALMSSKLERLETLILEQKTPSDRLTDARFEAIEGALKRVETKLEDKSKPGLLITVIALVWTITSAIGGFFINGQNATISRIEASIATKPSAEDVNRRLNALEEKRPGSSR